MTVTVTAIFRWFEGFIFRRLRSFRARADRMKRRRISSFPLVFGLDFGFGLGFRLEVKVNPVLSVFC